MDQTLTLKLSEFKQALTTLNEVLTKDFLNDIIIRDAAIQRFEYCYELCWKTLKTWLFTLHGQEALSPKETFRAICAHAIASLEDGEQLQHMVHDRNLTAHTYNERYIHDIVKRLPVYYEIMMRIEQNITK